jgi:nucleoside 2-deoxyribosyltransferase
VPATIYFSGSISGGRGDVATYRRMIEALEKDGHRVIAGAVAAENVSAGGESLTAREIFERDMRWLEEADVLVAEVSTPSTGVGYEIAVARYVHDIPVICLYRPAFTSRCTAMVAGDSGIKLLEYTDDSFDDLLARLSRALRE